jgi:hypothetical protein
MARHVSKRFVFVPGDEAIDGAVERGRRLELAPQPGAICFAFTDPAGGGSGANPDAYTVAITHREGDEVVVDAVRGTKVK